MLFKNKSDKGKEQPQIMQVNLVDVVKQANVQMKYEEIGSWLMMHKTPLFFCHDKGLSIVDRNFIEDRPWLKKAMNKMIKEIDDMKQKSQQQMQQAQTLQQAKDDKIKSEGTGYIG
jgi:hypothetical protein